MKLLVKICGLSTEATLDAALDAGADMVGFVFFDRSPRHVPLDAAHQLSERVAGRAKRVVLTVDADDASLAAAIAAFEPDMLQLHGTETPERIVSIRARFGLPVMKAIGLSSAADLGQIQLYDDIADQLLFDAKAPKEAELPGGNGACFDWTLLRGLKTRKPWMLAGGLTPENVAEALALTRAPGLDVSSGVESAAGIKDTHKISAFVAKARARAKTLGSPAKSR